MSYTPPAGSGVVLDFAPGYASKPPGAAVNLEFDPTAPSGVRQAGGFAAGTFGQPAIRLAACFLREQGRDTSVFGTPKIDKVALHIAPIGFDQSAVGTPQYVSVRQFVAPQAIDQPVSYQSVISVRNLGAYQLPPGANVVLEFFSSHYAAPPGSNVVLEFGAVGSGRILGATLLDTSAFGTVRVQIPERISPSGTDTSAYGLPDVQNRNKTVAPSGVAAGAFGTAQVVGSRFVSTTGIGPIGFGNNTTVWNFDQSVTNAAVNAAALHPTAFGTAFVSLFLRRITAAGAGDTSLFGTAFFAGGIRTLDLAGRGPLTSLFGTAFVAYRVRQVFPNWFIDSRYGAPLVDFNHSVVPAGIDSASFGTPDVHVPRSFVDLTDQGIPGAFGTTEIHNYITYVRPSGILPAPTLQEQFGHGVVDLWTKYIEQLFEPGPYDGGVFGNPINTFVDNRNKVVYTHGSDWAPLTHFGTAYIYNNARFVYGPPFLDFSLWGDTLVAYRVRTINAVGADSSEWGNVLNTIVYNAARVLAPAGWHSSAVGTPGRVWSNQQTLRALGGDQSSYGVPMVAFRVRTVAPYSLPDPPPFGDAHTQLWIRYLQPSGIDVSGRGVPTFEIHFTYINPKSVQPPLQAFGDARVWNLTPELGALGYEQTLWGRAAVFNQYERYTFTGFDATLWGNATVKDRRQWIAPTGILSLAMTLKNTVRNVLPDPPAQQTIVQDWKNAPPLTAYGIPTAYLATIYCEGDVLTLWGKPTVICMGFSPLSIPPPIDATTNSQFGIPSLSPTQYITFNGRDDDPPWTQWGTAVMWPHIIWAPRGYPYPPNDANPVHEEYIDERLYGTNNPIRPAFGTATVTLGRRTIVEYYDGQQRYFAAGTPSVVLRTQYIFPSGTRTQKFGVPELWGGDRSITQYYGPETLEFGQASIAFAPVLGPQTVRPGGFVAGDYGRTRVEYRNRVLTASGWDSFTTSTSRANLPPEWSDITNLITWVSNQYPPLPVPGFDASAFGTASVWFRVRVVETIGADTSIVADSTPGYFADRMRVWKRTYLKPPGVAPAGVGTANVQLALRSVRVGLGPNGRMGDAPSVRGINVVAPMGFDSAMFGDVQRWEAGKIKAHGDDLAAWGRAVIDRALHAGGFAAGEIGAPKMASGIGPSGFDAFDSGKPVYVARWCGNKAMAVAGFDAEVFGTAGVAHA